MRRVLEAALMLYAGIILLIALKASELPAANAAGGVSVNEAAEISGSENLAIDIVMPRVTGIRDNMFQTGLNDRIERQIAVSKEAAKCAADEFWIETKRKGYTPWQFVFYAGYEVKNCEEILSLKVTTLLYTGGTGLPFTEYYNADINKSRLLKLSDLFISDKYRDVIYGIVKIQMENGSDMYFTDDFKSITGNTEFFIHDGGLYITFDKYEVASGLAGEPEFRIPTKAIRSLLKDEYKYIFK